MSRKQLAKDYRERVNKRKFSELYKRFEDLSSDDEILNNYLPKRACSEIDYHHPSSGISDNESDYSELSDKDLQKDIESGRSSSEEDVVSITEIDELRQWAVDSNIPQSDLDKLLKILKRRLLPDLPSCSKTFLESNRKFDIKCMEVSDGSSGEFYHFGLINQLKETVKLEVHTSNILELTFNIDGVSPFKSSTIAVWPILCNIFMESYAYKPFTVSIYAGHGKPKSSIEYLLQFVLELNNLLSSGIEIIDKHFDVQVKHFVCDTPARSFVKSVLGHSAKKGCERCNVIGHKVDGVLVFLDTRAKERTDNDFRTHVDPDYHTGASILAKIKPPIDMINQFILDPMHLLYLGCTKRILEYLLNSSTSSKARLSATLKEELQRRTQQIQKDIPDEFPRKMRPINAHSKYKAVEYKFFILYAAPFILKKLLSDELYNHLMLFVTSIRLLSKNDPMPHTALARVKLEEFVNKSSSLYGPTFVSLNIHNLIHISSDVEKSGINLNQLSAFAFESYLGEITSLIRSPKHVVAQYCRRLLEKNKYSNKTCRVFKDFDILSQSKKEILKVKYQGVTLGIKHPNNTVILKNSNIVEIQKFLYVQQILHIEIKQYLQKSSFLSDPSLLTAWEVKKLSSSSNIIPVTTIKNKCIKFGIQFSKVEEKRSFVIPLLH